MFAAIGLVGTIVGTMVRKQMVRYFFPSGTACAVIQRAVTRELEPGQRNRPVFLLTVWGGIAALLTLPTKITLTRGGSALVRDWNPTANFGVGVDPLFYGIGLVVGPRIGLGMVIGALSVPYLIQPLLAGTSHEADLGDWVKWSAIAVLTLPTFATIVFAYLFHTPPVVPPGFTPGRTAYDAPPARTLVYGSAFVLATLGAGVLGNAVFGLPWYATILTVAIAWPLSVVNGRVTGDTDINPIRLVAIVLLSGFFWVVARDAAVLLGMAVVGATIASVAVDIMQDYRTGYLLEQDPAHQTSVQFVGVVMGALAAIPVLGLLLGRLGIGPGSSLPAPGAQVWAAMAEAMTDGFHPRARWSGRSW